MTGLLLKDYYTLIKQMRIIILILLIFTIVPGGSLSMFAIVYAAMLPYTALAYDERSKWDDLAVMMPYSTKSIVGSKYLLGFLAVVAASIISGVAQLALSTVKATSMTSADIIELLLLACMAMILLSINLPWMFWLGVERGRIAFLIIICGGVTVGMAAMDYLPSTLGYLNNIGMILIGALFVTGTMITISVMISVKVYQRKKG